MQTIANIEFVLNNIGSLVRSMEKTGTNSDYLRGYLDGVKNAQGEIESAPIITQCRHCHYSAPNDNGVFDCNLYEKITFTRFGSDFCSLGIPKN